MKDRYAKYYDLIFRHKDYNYECEFLKKYLVGKTILDVGCGTGIHGEILQKSGFEMYGVEPSQVAADISMTKGFKKVWVSDVESMKVDGRFDNVVLLFQVFNYLKSPDKALSQIYNVLKDGGRVIIDILNYDAKLRKFAIHYKFPVLRVMKTKRVGKNTLLIDHLLPFQFVYERWAHYLYTKYEMITMLNNNGFFLEHYLEDPFGSLIICKKR